KLGNFDNATENILKSLAYWENVGNKANMWNCNEVLGNICIKCQDFEKALHYHRIALNIREQTINYRISKGGNKLTENYLGVAYSYNNIAETYLNMGIADSALFYAIRSLEIKLSENSVASAMDVANSHLILGKVYHTLRKHDSAIIILNRAAESYKKIGNKSGQSEALLGLGKAYVSTNLPDKAIIAYETGLSLAKEANAKSNILEGYQLLNEYYTKERNFEKALLHFNSYNNYKDSIFNIERINKIEELQIKYETEKQQQELEFHKVLVQKKKPSA
ncbi:MAG TPA: tetratricopeptide repeat protein, partial [Bacteroidales bacterium]|nr:tetratricopeptide repeat protein [Bacteroidales bacterium]